MRPDLNTYGHKRGAAARWVQPDIDQKMPVSAFGGAIQI